MHYNLSLFVNSETLLQVFCKEELLKRTTWAKAIKKSDYKILQEKKWNKLMQFWQTWESRYVSEKKKGQNYFQRIYLVFYNVLSNSLYLGEKSDILKRFSTHNYIDSRVKNYSAVVFDLLLLRSSNQWKISVIVFQNI